METIKELSKEKKLKLLRELLKYHRGYLCAKIENDAYQLRYITTQQFLDGNSSDTAQALIPELLQIKPDDCDFDAAWFDFSENEDAPDTIRKDVLKKLIKLIKKSYEN